VSRRHWIVAGLGYGDEGKGTITDYLCAREEAGLVVRFNGGCQAGHNVITDDDRHHCFSQFGSGMLRPGVRTFLSRFMMVEPLALAAEAEHLTKLGIPDALDRIVVDARALLTTPYHAEANKARERARGMDRHGSCGKGIGETARYATAWPADAPRAADCLNPALMLSKLQLLRSHLQSETGPFGEEVPSPEELADAYKAFAWRVMLTVPAWLRWELKKHTAVFEGAQGVLLDEKYGTSPYNTWSATTFANAEQLLAEAGQEGTRIGVTRTYMTRHGAGPFLSEDETLNLPEPHNFPDEWQGEVRQGHLDIAALRYALDVCGGADQIALTHVDTAENHPELRIQFDGARAENVRNWVAIAEASLGVPVTVASYGPRASDKKDLREVQ
jgi:adenylosuccinate synthase